MKVMSLGYIGVESPEAKEWERFGPDVLGMSLAEPGSDGSVYLRMDDRHHRLAIHPGDQDRIAYIGWELASAGALELAGAELTENGIHVQHGSEDELRDRQVRNMIHVVDPAGLRHELFWGQFVDPLSFHPGRRMNGFVTGGQGLGHCVLVVPDHQAAAHFYERHLGFELSDEIRFGDSSGLFFHCNSRHHSLAMIELPELRGLHHIMIEVNDLDDLGMAYDICEAEDLVTTTIGRHSNDRMVSFYLRTPSSFGIEYGWGGLTIDDPSSWTAAYLDRGDLWGHRRLFPAEAAAGAMERIE